MSVFSRLKEKRTKNVLLLAPTSTYEVGMTKWLSANLGIERIAGYLRANGHHAETYDMNLYKATGEGPSFEDRLHEIDWDVIGFSVYESTMANDINNMLLAQKACPEALIIAGGHTAQFDYQTLLDKSPARIVVLGEGEKPLLQLVEGTPLEEINGIVLKSLNPPLTQEEFHEISLSIDYDRIPYEQYWDYYIGLYRESGQEITPELSRQIHTIRIYSRNYCPMGCKFCSSTNFLNAASGLRAAALADLTADDLIDLLKSIIKSHPRVETIYFTDDDFCTRKRQLIEFLNKVIAEKLPLTFISFARIDDLDEEVISLMVKAGFRTLNIGIENYQPEILKEYNKRINVETIDKNLKLLNQYGIRPAVTFILCSPEAKLQWVENTTIRILEELEKETFYPGINVTVQPQKGSSFHEEYNDFEIQTIEVPGTRIKLKRVHFIKCTDPETREFQYRFLYRWTYYIDELYKKHGGHLNAQTQSVLKLKLILEVIDEIKSERGSENRWRYTHMSTQEKEQLWKILEKYSYGASL